MSFAYQTASWIPVNRAAKVVSELLFAPTTSPNPIFHLENPTRQSWLDIFSVISCSIGAPSDLGFLPFEHWLDLVKDNSDSANNPCAKIIPFLEQEFLHMATGDVVLDTTHTRSVSATLAGSQALSEEHLRKFVDYWKREKFI